MKRLSKIVKRKKSPKPPLLCCSYKRIIDSDVDNAVEVLVRGLTTSPPRMCMVLQILCSVIVERLGVAVVD